MHKELHSKGITSCPVDCIGSCKTGFYSPQQLLFWDHSIKNFIRRKKGVNKKNKQQKTLSESQNKKSTITGASHDNVSYKTPSKKEH
jgi:hypothetical protein